jgi:hypothetical protein
MMRRPGRSRTAHPPAAARGSALMRAVLVLCCAFAFTPACATHDYPDEPAFPPVSGYPAQPGGAPPRGIERSPGGGAMAVPGTSAVACTDDAACGLSRCNKQLGPRGAPYNKCAFPCVRGDVDCAAGATCNAGFCLPKPE